jgi:hypothetical protein
MRRVAVPSLGRRLEHFSIDGLVSELQGRIAAALERGNKKCKTFQSAPAKFFDVRHDSIIR